MSKIFAKKSLLKLNHCQYVCAKIVVPKYFKLVRAFTLFEILLVLTITSILFISTVIGWRYLIAHNQLAVLSNQIVRAIRFTRSAAISRHVRITFCGSTNKKECDGRWNNGQIIYDAKNKIILREYPKVAKAYRLTWRSSLGRNALLQFEPDGFTNGQQGSFTLCHVASAKDKSGIKLKLLRSGRLVSEKYICKSSA